MQKYKSFVKKTKKGAIVKVVREHYLRDDIWCGVKGCDKCQEKDPPLDTCPDTDSDLCLEPHYLMPDTNVVLHQIDVLDDAAFTNIIILQIVLQEIKHRNLGTYNKIRTLISNPSKKFYVFANELNRETFIEREPDESSNDRNDRAIRTAAKWYSAHIPKYVKSKDEPSKVVLVTNDRQNMEKAKEEGISAFTVHEYVTSLKSRPSLLDLLASCGSEADGGGTDGEGAKKSKVVFAEHLPLSSIQKGIKSGRFVQGIFQGSRENYLEGKVNLDLKNQSSKDGGRIFVKGLKNLNRSVHGDMVAVEVLPKAEWSAPSGVVMKNAELAQMGKGEAKTDDSDDDDEGLLDDDKNEASTKIIDRQTTGRVVGIIRRNWRAYCGTLLPLTHSRMASTRRHLFLPADRTVPRIRLETRQADTLLHKRIIVSIDSWPRTSRYPLGHFVRTLGDIGDKETENEVLLLEHDVPHQSFSKSVLDDLPQMPWGITADDIKSRTDLRHLAVCSVDPPGCTDIDDALHCLKMENGNMEIGVHIADVSHFIRPGTSLDKEAENRGTTVYLADQRIDMVPELLSSNLCSLRNKEERLAFSVLWEMTNEAEVVGVRFCKSVIRSHAALTYAEAQMAIDNANLMDSVTVSLRNLNRLAKILKKKRVDNGALTLVSPEVRFEVDSETHDPVDLQAKELRETNSLVEEFMLLANISVAKRIYEEFSLCALLRCHPSPPLPNYDILIKAGACKGIQVDVDSAKALAVSLDKAVLPNEPYFNTMMRVMATRCMMQALYFCSGCSPMDEFHHYGLATPIYTHFTSPIRRYSDIIVHRLLAVSIQADSTYRDLLDKDKTQILCNHLNHRHKNAQYASRASVNLHTHIFFRNRREVEEAFVLFVKKNALHVLVPKYGLESMIFFDLDHTDSSRVLDVKADDSVPSLTVEGVKFHLFDRLRVMISVEQSNIQQFRLKLSLVEPEVPGVSVKAGDVNGLNKEAARKRTSMCKSPPAPKRTKLL